MTSAQREKIAAAAEEYFGDDGPGYLGMQIYRAAAEFGLTLANEPVGDDEKQCYDCLDIGSFCKKHDFSSTLKDQNDAEKYTENRSKLDYYNASIDNRIYCA